MGLVGRILELFDSRHFYRVYTRGEEKLGTLKWYLWMRGEVEIVKVALGKWLWRMILVAILLGVALAYGVNVMLGYPASATQISPSGRFVMENVRVDGVFLLGGMAYLRVTDTQTPGKVYRTPLYGTQSLDMRAFENDHEVGVYWIKFDWQKKLFVISIPEWEEHWMDAFVSNTSYAHFKN